MVLFKEETKKIASVEKLLAKVHPPHLVSMYSVDIREDKDIMHILIHRRSLEIKLRVIY